MDDNNWEGEKKIERSWEYIFGGKFFFFFKLKIFAQLNFYRKILILYLYYSGVKWTSHRMSHFKV